MTGQSGEGAEITLGARIRGDHLEHAAAGQAIEFKLGLEQRQRTVQAAGVQFGIVGYSISHGFTPRQIVERPRISGPEPGVRLQ
ncbi:hypothetical protein D3C85_1807150 [compost metagenome]